MGAGAVRSRALGGSLGCGRAGGDMRVLSTLMRSQEKEVAASSCVSSRKGWIYFLTQSYGLLARW